MSHGQPPLCKCGCGAPVTWDNHRTVWHLYAKGHAWNRQGRFSARSSPPLCACGCGEFVVQGHGARWNKWIYGHAKGWKCAPRSTEHRKKIGAAKKHWLLTRDHPMLGKKWPVQSEAKRGLKNPMHGKRGANSHSWKGGRVVDSGGYILVHSSGHPRARNLSSGRGGYVPEHVLVMEKVLGRYITRTEAVHHIDGNKKNNDSSNLVVLPSQAAHRGVHGFYVRIVADALKRGLLQIDWQKKEFAWVS